MTRNIGTLDRWIRAALAIVIALITLLQLSGVWAFIGGVLAIFIMYQAVSGWCLVYQVLGRNTCPIEDKKQNA